MGIDLDFWDHFKPIYNIWAQHILSDLFTIADIAGDKILDIYSKIPMSRVATATAK